MNDSNNPTAANLIASHGANLDQEELALAAHYAPVLQFDAAEPFLPLLAGYTIFREPGPSPSFPRTISLDEPGRPLAAAAIEYAIWWDWDIEHLYELEHVWVYLDETGQIVRGEASWHGGQHDMSIDGKLPLIDNRLAVFSEPGKHAFAPTPAWFETRAERTRKACTRLAGCDGLLVTRRFEGIIGSKTPQADRLVWTYLQRQAFEPTLNFTQIYPLPPEALVPWPALLEWIPDRVDWWLAELERTIPPHERRFLRIAHRGASALAQENTLAAIKKAADLDADMVELDVQMSADGEPVIIHAADLSETTSGSGPVSGHTLAELKQLDAGNGEQIPTLAEAVDCCLAHDLSLYLELKSGGAIQPVAELIRTRRLYGQVIVASFRPDWLAELKHLDEKITTSILFGSTHLDPVGLARAINAGYVHPAWERQAPEPHKLLTTDWIERVRAAGLGLICWHEERPTEIAALRRLGVDGICSDAPELLI